MTYSSKSSVNKHTNTKLLTVFSRKPLLYLTRKATGCVWLRDGDAAKRQSVKLPPTLLGDGNVAATEHQRGLSQKEDGSYWIYGLELWRPGVTVIKNSWLRFLSLHEGKQRGVKTWTLHSFWRLTVQKKKGLHSRCWQLCLLDTCNLNCILRFTARKGSTSGFSKGEKERRRREEGEKKERREEEVFFLCSLFFFFFLWVFPLLSIMTFVWMKLLSFF